MTDTIVEVFDIIENILVLFGQLTGWEAHPVIVLKSPEGEDLVAVRNEDGELVIDNAEEFLVEETVSPRPILRLVKREDNPDEG